MPDLPIIARGRRHADRVAFRTPAGTQTYGEVLAWSSAIAATLLDGGDDLRQTRVVLLAAAGGGYTAAQWAVWRAGGIVVPIGLAATAIEWEYTLRDAQARIVVADGAGRRGSSRSAAASGCGSSSCPTVRMGSPRRPSPPSASNAWR